MIVLFDFLLFWYWFIYLLVINIFWLRLLMISLIIKFLVISDMVLLSFYLFNAIMHLLNASVFAHSLYINSLRAVEKVIHERSISSLVLSFMSLSSKVTREIGYSQVRMILLLFFKRLKLVGANCANLLLVIYH
jgi:hypothetical protein